MERLNYNTTTPMGQMVAEGINDLQNGFFKITRTSEAIKLMDEAQAASELGISVEQLAAFTEGLEQLKNALNAYPFTSLLPKYDQG